MVRLANFEKNEINFPRFLAHGATQQQITANVI